MSEMKTVIAYYSKHHGNTKKLLGFGPFKLVGGLKKGHPTEEEIRNAVVFYQNLE